MQKDENRFKKICDLIIFLINILPVAYTSRTALTQPSLSGSLVI